MICERKGTIMKTPFWKLSRLLDKEKSFFYLFQKAKIKRIKLCNGKIGKTSKNKNMSRIYVFRLTLFIVYSLCHSESLENFLAFAIYFIFWFSSFDFSLDFKRLNRMNWGIMNQNHFSLIIIFLNCSPFIKTGCFFFL